MRLNLSVLVRIAIISALLTQVSHAAYLFNSVSKSQSNIDTVLSYVFAFSLELSTYIFTIAKKQNIASFFSFIAIVINILYYWSGNVFDYHFYASLTISCVLPVAIWFYSELLVIDIKNTKSKATKAINKSLKSIIKN